MKLTVALTSGLLAAACALVRASEPLRYIVYPKAGLTVDPEVMRFFELAENVKLVHELELIDAMAVEVSDTLALDKVMSQPWVSHMEKDVVRSVIPTVEEFNAFRGRHLQSLPTYGLKMVGADVTPLANVTRDDLMVCVIDSGAQKDHPGLVSAGLEGEPDFSPDTCGHGTHVTGTIAAKGGFGVAPGVFVYNVKVFDGTSCQYSFASDILAATQLCVKAAKGAKIIINMSLGGSLSSTAEEQGFARLNQSGVLSIAAAGNSGNTRFSYPASYPSVMSVAAIDSRKGLASFSQRNREVDIAAPGVNVYSAFRNNGFRELSGTSMACPHVVGAAAVVWSYGLPNDWTNQDVRQALEATAEDLGTPGRDDSFGNGLVNVCKAAKLAGFDPENNVVCP